MRKALLPILGVIWFAFATMSTSFAQQNGIIRCATMEQDAILRANNPNLGTLDDMEQMLAPLIKEKQQGNPNAHIVNGVYIIPIVVHVIHNGEAVGTGNNISYARIASQIETLNDDFRRRAGTNGFNTNPVGADTQIEFRLAQRQPNGTAFAEIGVNRINRNAQGWPAIGAGYTTGFVDANIKPFTTTTQNYDGTVYMSFWCVPLSGGILGYAQFPQTTLGGMDCNATNTVTDGVVMTTGSVGGETTPGTSAPYDLGRTATHEIGHWLGLRHIWGDGGCGVDDFCADTPTAGASNGGCATGTNSCTDTPVDFPDMVENYMDYSTDICMNIFTNDQKIRMRTILETSRFSLINSVASIPPNPSDAGVLAILSPISDVCNSSVTSSVRIKNYGSTALTSVTVEYRIDAATFVSQAFTGLNVPANGTLDLTLNAITGVALGNHTFEARTILPNGVTDPFTASDLSNSTFTLGTGALPILADFEGADFPPTSWERQNPGDDCDLWVADASATLIGLSGGRTKAALVRHHTYSGAAQEDILVSPSINLTTAGLASAGIEFDLAYRQRNGGTSETLRIEVSTDCGATWVAAPLYSKTGTALATVATTSATAFIPTAGNQWRRESVSLNAYIGQSIKVRFVTVNANGNNLWIDNVKIYDARPTVEFTSTTNTIIENSVSGTVDCRGYQDVTIPVSITIPPASAVTVNVAATGGTMNAQDYILQTPAITFPIGSSASQNVVVRVFNDNALEVAENLQLTLSVVGTAAILGTNAVHTLTVNDNDDITLAVTQTLFSENFEAYTAGAVSNGWTVTNVVAGGTNNWVFGENGGMTGTRSAYITNNATTRPLAYTNTSTSRRRLISPAINTVGATNLQLSFDFKANGEGTTTIYDYGRLMYATNPAGPYTNITGPVDGTANGTAANAAPFFGESASTAYTVTLPAACQNQATLYVVWRWDNDGSVGTNPPFTVDNIVLTGNVLSEYPVENTITSKEVYLGANSTVYVISSNNKIMAKLENNTTHDYGCTTVAIDRVGTGAAAYTATGAVNGLTQKSFRITPTNTSTENADVTLYYTNAEKTGWEAATGLSWTTDAEMHRTGGAISAITPATATANGATNSNHAITNSAYLTTEHAVKATINNGFGNGNASGGFAIGDPRECLISAIAFVSQTACVPATNQYTANVTVTYNNPSGNLVVNGQTFTTTTSPQTVTLTNLVSDGLAVNIVASFSGNATCTFTSNSAFTAPVSCNVVLTGTVTLGTVTPTTYCAGTTISVPYTTSGTFGGTNQFTAQLSDAAGSFTTPIATASGVSPISLTIPSGATTAATYKVRVISTQPSSTSAEATITVNASPTVTLSAFTGVCSTTTAFALSGGLPAGGTYSGTGVTAGSFDPATAGIGTHTITYSVTVSGCTNTATQNIVVSSPTTVTLSAFTSVCSTTTTFALSGGLPAGGTYSGTGVTAGNFNPATAGVGTHTITYTFVNGGCSNTATQNIVVSAPTTVTLSAFASVCTTTTAFALTGGLPAGGTYSGTGVSGGNFNPTTAGIGTHTITYTVVNGGCSNTATQNIVVSSPTTVTLSAFTSVCSTTATFALTGGLPVGGTYTGTGVTAGNFNPATAGVGTHTITYTVVNGGCSNSATQNIVVSAPIAAPTLSAFASVCSSQAIFALTGGLPVGGTYSGTGVSGGNFNPATAGVGTHTITYTVVNGGCSNSVTQNIVVSAPTAIVTLSTFTGVCSTTATFALTGGLPAGGTYTGTGVSGGNFNPATAGVGTHAITYTVVNGGCSNTATQNIVVSAPTTPTLSALTGVCSTTATFALTGGLPAGGTYTGTGVSGGNFNPTTAGVGTHTITYTVVNGACSNTATQNIVVSSPTTVTLSAFTGVCSTQASFALTGGLPVGGTYTGTGVTAGNFNPATAGVGTHTITYTVVNGACSNTATQNIVVSAPPVASLVMSNACLIATNHIISGGLPAGGTYSGANVIGGTTFDAATAGVGTHAIAYTVTIGTCTSTANATITVIDCPSGGSTPTITAPTAFTAIGISTSQINLSWDAVSGATGYLLYAGNTLIATLISGTTTFQHTGLDADRRYLYRLVATNGATQSLASQTNGSTFPNAPVVLSNTAACGTGSAMIVLSASGAVYNIYLQEIGGFPIDQTNIATYRTPSISENTVYYISVVGIRGLESTRTRVEAVVIPAVELTITEGSRVRSCDATTTLTANQVDNATYTWLVNGVEIDDSNTTILTVTRSGNYQVRVRRANCITTSTFSNVTLNYAPLAEITNGLAIGFCENGILRAREVANTTYSWTLNNIVVGTERDLSISQSGEYTLTVTENGCSATDAIQVVVTSLPSVSVEASSTTFCPDGEVTLTTNQINGVTYDWNRNGRVIRRNAQNSITVTTGGEYSVTISQNGCNVSSSSVNVERLNVLPAYLRTTETTLFVESENAIASVTWRIEDADDTSLEGQITVTPTESASYSALVTYENGCSIRTRTVRFNVAPPVVVVVGEEEEFIKALRIYPNPSITGVFQIDLGQNTEAVTLILTDQLGRTLETIVLPLDANSYQLDLSKYASALYTLQFKSEKGVITRKIVIEK